MQCWGLEPLPQHPPHPVILTPLKMKRQRPHFPHSQSQGDGLDYTRAESLLEGQKRRGHHPIVGDVNLPIGLFNRIHLG